MASGLLHLNTHINISLVSDFFIKLMKLPIAFFDTRMTGDILQRINAYIRIERVLSELKDFVNFKMEGSGAKCQLLLLTLLHY